MYVTFYIFSASNDFARKNVVFAHWFNSNEPDESDENCKDALHDRVQAKQSRVAFDTGVCQPDAVRANLACGFAQTSQSMIQAVEHAIHGIGHAARRELSGGTLGRQKKYAIFYMPVRLR